MDSGTTFWSIQKLSLFWIFCYDPNNFVGKNNWRVATKSWQPEKKFFTQSDANVNNNPRKIVRILNESRQSISTNHHFPERKSATHEDMQLYKNSCKLYLIMRFSLRPTELMTVVDIVGKYYRWFNVSPKPLKDNIVLEFINEDIKNLLGLMQWSDKYYS